VPIVQVYVPKAYCKLHHWYPTSPGKLAQKSCVALIIISSSSALERSKESRLNVSSASSGGTSFGEFHRNDCVYAVGVGAEVGGDITLWFWGYMTRGFDCDGQWGLSMEIM
jgi:hypothetical protein